MPMLVEHIDAIARKKQHDVLAIYFHPETVYEDWGSYNYKRDPHRKRVILWLKKHKIEWQECGDFASENCMCSYLGQIYIDVPFDENDPQYQLVRDYLENLDGSMRNEQVIFRYLPLELAMKNAHHDVPGFWEKWAENF
jgi:hypothetical protein